VEFGLLGPVQAWVGQRPVNVGVRKQRLVLAVLALEVNRLVTVERLVDLCWPEDPPPSARRVVHGHVSRLRTTLANIGAAEHQVDLRGHGSGYLLACDPERVDAHRFTALLARARQAGDDEARVELLEQALALWRGPALAGAAPGETRARLSAQLDQARLSAVEDRLEALLRLGRHQEVIVAASPRVGEHRQRITGVLMLALHRTGRTAEALSTYQEARRRLAAELGIDPPADLQQLELAMLRGEPALASPRRPTPAGTGTPRQLPADAVVFTGRKYELDKLRTPLPADEGRLSRTVVIFAIDGMAGVGKTALALHAAHRLADRFPDGQVFLDLHGYTQGIEPVDPATALATLLRTLGVSGEQIPGGLDERAAMYRTRLADKAMLIVLDDASSETQVQPLLPAGPGCLVLITSRRRLGLDGATPLSIDTLPQVDAVALFTQAAGTDRCPPGLVSVVEEIVELCGRLPLAIRIAAARLRHRPAWTVEHLADLLRDHQHRLAELEVGQRSVAAAFALSYHHLSADQQRTFRRLGLHPGTAVDRYAAAALTDTTARRAGRTLDDLLDAHLLTQPVTGRYRFHDLLRSYATHTARTDESTAALHAALTRLLDYYTHTTAAATCLLYPHVADRNSRAGTPRTATPALSDTGHAAAWLDDELPNLLTTAAHAATHGWPTHTIELATLLHHHLRTRARYGDAVKLHQHALDAARATLDLAGEAGALNHLGDIFRPQGHYDTAADHYADALHIARTTGDRTAELTALTGLADVHRAHGRHGPATETFTQALEIARATGNGTGELHALVGLGYTYFLRGEDRPATDSYTRALDIARATDDHDGQLTALNGLGAVHWTRGRHSLAIDSYRQVLDIARATGNPTAELIALNGLGAVHRNQGNHVTAADSCTRALEIARAIGHRTGELNALTSLGTVCRTQGRHGPAIEHYTQVLQTALAIGYRNYQFEGLYGLGRTHHATGRHHEGRTALAQALDLADELGQRHDQARAHDGLARAHCSLGQHQQAREHWQRALNTLTNLGITRAEEANADDIRANLANLPNPANRETASGPTAGQPRP
jgi:DNA-binding SARP family transcriptional activator/tetratricopeptide (TPR) repeat protein